MIMESSTDAAEWRLEVERVLPQLKITVRADNKVTNLCLGCGKISTLDLPHYIRIHIITRYVIFFFVLGLIED